MSEHTFPQLTSSKLKGSIGQTFFANFVHQLLNFSYRPVPQESDFGIDGYIDIVIGENVTGRTLAVQIKCGDSYYAPNTEGDIKYNGENKHLNFYLNTTTPIILVVLNSSCTKGCWVQFKKEIIMPSTNGWHIEMPSRNVLSKDIIETWTRIAGPAIDHTEAIRHSWKLNDSLDAAGFQFFQVEKDEILDLSFKSIEELIERSSRSRQSLIKNQGKVELFIDGFNEDPREIYEIPEIRNWYAKSLELGIPWLYFLSTKLDAMDLLHCLMAMCDVTAKPHFDGTKHITFDRPEQIGLWLIRNLENLLQFTARHNLPSETSQEIYENTMKFIRTTTGFSR